MIKNEYPRPQLRRSSWINLNGEWEFEFDFGMTGRDRGLQNAKHLEKKIVVPFCPESELSGIGYKDFMNAVWYKKTVHIEKPEEDRRLLLHFEAVDHYCEVWINGKFVGKHTGGYTPFCFDITSAICEGENQITVYAKDDSRDPMQPRGKQSEIFQSHGCDYTRTTGIWQTVWMEEVVQNYIRSYRCEGDIDNCSVHLEFALEGYGSKALTAIARYHGKEMGRCTKKCGANVLHMEIPLAERHLWEPGAGELYDLEFCLESEDGQTDEVCGYFGLRSVSLGKNAILINGKPVFQRLVLDQGFYRDGIYTAPTDEHLKRDIELSMAMGFNGARLHERVFERRFLYWADHLGYLVWGEYGNWGLDHCQIGALSSMLEPWIEAVERDYNSPALIGWCPFNETWDRDGRKQDNRVLTGIYRATKAMDHTRPVIDTSGNFHVVTDVYDIHDYEQNVEKFASHYEPMKNGGAVYDNFPNRQHHAGEPYFVSEYGGILWNEQSEQGWGYGNAPKSMDEFADRYCGLASTLLDNPNICALCYTQLYDVEQEKNGIYTYDRGVKFPQHIIDRMRSTMMKKAAIEE